MIDNLEEKITFFHTLNERQRRLFAAAEANALGWHGVLWVSQAFDIHPHTIREGKKELAPNHVAANHVAANHVAANHVAANHVAANHVLSPGRVRREGGGRKKKTIRNS